MTVKVKCELLHNPRSRITGFADSVEGANLRKTENRWNHQALPGVLTTELQSLSGRLWTAKRSKAGQSSPRGISDVASNGFAAGFRADRADFRAVVVAPQGVRRARCAENRELP